VSAELGQFLAPRYLVSVEGTKLRGDVTKFIGGVRFREAEDDPSRIILTVLNERFRFLDERVFAEGNKVDLWLGYAGRPLTFMDRGTIVAPNPNFPRSGMPTMTVEAFGAARILMDPDVKKRDRGRVFRQLRDSEIAAKLFREEGIMPFIVHTKDVVTRVKKRGQTRWDFLKQLAQLHGWVVSVRHNLELGAPLGYFGPPDVEDQPTKRCFTYGGPDATLFSFSPRFDFPSQATKVELAYTDPKTGKTYRVSTEVHKKTAEKTRFAAAVGRDKLREPVKNGPTVALTVFGQREVVMAPRPFASPGAAKRFAAAWFAQHEREFAWGDGEALGTPDVRQGHVHEIAGIGPRLSGNWQFTEVEHDVTRGYALRFKVRKVVLGSVVGSLVNLTGTTLEEAEA